MVKGIGVDSMQKALRQYWVVGRKTPSEKDAEPTCYRIRVFARDPVLARSRFWYQMKRQNKVRRTQGEIINVSEIFERNTNSVKNYGIVIKYESRKGMLNMYKEYRSNSICNAMSMLYSEMAGRHSARGNTIHVIKTSIVPDNAVVRANSQQMVPRNLRFPKITTAKRAPTAQHANSRFFASRPILI
jgi:large subunit ribosomal protein L18Ae